MSNLFWTTNKTTDEALEIDDLEKVTSIDLQSYAGQEDIATIRIGNPSAYPEAVFLYSTDPKVTFSLNESTGYAPALDVGIEAEKVSDTVFIRLNAPLTATEGARESTVISDDIGTLTVRYYLASVDEGDLDTISAAERFSNDETFYVLEQFESQGEAVAITRYDPKSKPVDANLENPIPHQLQQSLNDPAQWCNPQNPLVGYTIVDEYHCKAFIGDQDLATDTEFDFTNNKVDFEDVSTILLPADFEGFNPKPIHTRVPWGHGISRRTYCFQQTQYTMRRHNVEYALINPRRQKYFRGQVLFWVCDLARIHHPGLASAEAFLPWNQLYDETGKVIQYVKSFSRDQIDGLTCCPYLEDAYDPYCANRYQGEISTVTYDGETWSVEDWLP